MPDNPPQRPFLDAAVAFGANLGDPPRQFAMAEAMLSGGRGLRPKAKSGLWLTEPVGGPPGQDWYHNQVILYEAALGPRKLMGLLLGVEGSLGRARGERWGPRVMDLDLLFLGDTVLDDDVVTLPHPRLHERAFVLRPLSEVAPRWVHPLLGLDTLSLLARVPPGGPGIRRKGPAGA
jgi:2-amino-4-hydroxy-6-hydroxymethyldihydropteridine diphosphokinase